MMRCIAAIDPVFEPEPPQRTGGISDVPPLLPSRPLQYLSIRVKLMAAVGVALIAVLLLTGSAVVVLLDSIDKSAQLEARNLATSIAIEAPSKEANLQSYIQNLGSIYGLDLFILDRDRRTIADVVATEIGERYKGDLDGEIDQTLRDGQPHSPAITWLQPRNQKSPNVPGLCGSARQGS